MPCKGLKNSAQGNALGGKENEYERLKAAEQRLIATGSLVNVASPRLNAAEQRLIATASLVNVAEQRLKAAEQQVNCDDSLVNVAEQRLKAAEQRLKDTQSQGDDSPATPLLLTAAKLLRTTNTRTKTAWRMGTINSTL